MSTFSKKNSSDWTDTGKKDSLGRPIWAKTTTVAAAQGSASGLADIRGDFTPEESEARKEHIPGQIDSTYGFAQHLMSEGISPVDFLEMDEEEQFDHIADYTTSEEDIDAIQEELSTHEFSRFHDSSAKRDELNQLHNRYAYYSKDAYPEALKPVELYSSTGDDALYSAYEEAMLTPSEDGGYRGTYTEFAESGLGQDIAMDNDRMFREGVKEVVGEWRGRTDKRNKTVLIEGNGIGWQRLSGHKIMNYEDFENDPVSAIAPDTQEFFQVWTQDKDGKTITVHQSHHDAQQETYAIQMLTKKELKRMGVIS